MLKHGEVLATKSARFPSALLCCVCVYVRLIAQLYPNLCDPLDCSLPGSSVHEIFRARRLE